MGMSFRSGTLATGTLVRTGEERATLVRRTYALVFSGIVVTTLGAFVAFTQPQVMGFAAEHPIILFLIAFAPLFMAQKVARTFPANIGFTYLYTFLIGVWIAPLLAYFERNQPGIVGNAALLTGTSFAVLTGYAFVSRRDFSAWGSFLVVGLWVLIATSVISLFFHSATTDLWLASVTVLLFSGLLVFDTWRLRHTYGPDDYVPAAINIYLDLLNMFLAILRILGGGQRR
jgi:FtsH-binding integral membrane protein